VCVIGVPHDVLGELACACIVLVEGAVVTGSEIRRFAQDTMAADKIPDLVRFFEAFPMTGSGTVRRRELARAVALTAHPAGGPPLAPHAHDPAAG
jgi:fatty-acyl-CoA synthase